MKHREDSAYQVYKADYSDVFESASAVLKDAKFSIFTEDRIRGFIAVMGIPGVVNTTEVGVFITEPMQGQGIKVELSSRSTPAKKAVAAMLFSRLAEKFTKI